MKAFISYRHKGEEPAKLLSLLTSVRDGLTAAGISAYCTFFDEDTFIEHELGARDIMKHAFGKINAVDVLIVILTSDEKSEGMLMEIGYCLAKGIPVVVAAKQSVKKSYLPEMADFSIVWSDVRELSDKVSQLPLVERPR